MEKWKSIKGYEGFYEVSDQGRVKSLERVIKHPGSEEISAYDMSLKERIKHPHVTPKGYLQVSLCRDGTQKQFLVHRLVAATFISNPKKLPHINHKDFNKRNAAASNLEWVTNEQNIQHYRENTAIEVLREREGRGGVNSKWLKRMRELGIVK